MNTCNDMELNQHILAILQMAKTLEQDQREGNLGTLATSLVVIEHAAKLAGWRINQLRPRNSLSADYFSLYEGKGPELAVVK